MIKINNKNQHYSQSKVILVPSNIKNNKFNYKFVMKFKKENLIYNLLIRHHYNINIEKYIKEYDVINIEDDIYFYVPIGLNIEYKSLGSLIKRKIMEELIEKIYARNIYGDMTTKPINYYSGFL